jgi:hypothetical protein
MKALRLPTLPPAASRAHEFDVSRRAAIPADWPFGELTQDQRLSREKQEARMRAGALRGLPSVFGELA